MLALIDYDDLKEAYAIVESAVREGLGKVVSDRCVKGDDELHEF